MPAAVAAIAVQAAIGVATSGISIAASLAITAVSYLAQSLISSALSPKPKTPQSPNFARQLQDNVLTIRQAAAPRKIVFGRARVGGIYTFMHTTGSDNNVLHTVVTVTGHAVRGFDALYLDDEVVPLDSNGNATGKYAGVVKCIYGLGTTAGDSAFNSALTAAVGSSLWGANHLQAGCAKAYIAFTFDDDLFNGGLPNPSFVCSGYAGVQDPRFATSPVTEAWTDNAALCIAQYLRDTSRGLGYVSADIDETALIAAANDCDEMVDRVSAAVTFTAVASTDILTVADTDAHLRTGTRVQASTTTTLPSGLSPSTNYFWIALTPTTGKLATSLANARSGTNIDITSAGTGTHTLTVNAEPRYTLNGWIDTSEDPSDVLPRMLSAMAGTKAESGGLVVLLSGVWRTASNAIVEADRDGRVQSRHRRSRRDVFNGVKGIFVNPDDNFQPTDFPAVAPAAYLTEDNSERIWKDAELKFTDSPSMAQRIARIDLEKNRRQQAATVPLTLAGMKHRAGDNVTFTNEKRGWEAKTFTIDSWLLEPRDLGGSNPRFGTVVSLSEIDANVFAWTPGTDEAAMTASVLTTLPDAFNATEPTSLALASGTSVLGIRLDGTVFSRIQATWTAPADAQVVSGGTIEIQYKKSAASTWLAGGSIAGDQTEAFILDVDDGVSYDVRIRARRGSGAKSDWVTSSNHTVIGKTAPPSNVSSLSAQQNASTVTFSWPQVTDKDLAGYEIRYMTAPFVWANATSLTKTTRGTRITSAAVPPSPTDTTGDQIPWVFGIKAVDTSENESTTEATRQLTVINAFDIIRTEEQWPLWSGLQEENTLIALANTGSPYLTVYTIDGTSLTKVTNSWTQPAGSATSALFSPDGSLLAVGHFNSPYLTVYTVSGTTLTKIGNPATLPASTSRGVAFSPDGSLLAVAHDGTPYLTVYTVSGTTLTKIANFWTPPTSNPRAAAFSPDGSLLAVAHFSSPYLTVYTVSGTTLTKIGDPATLPARHSYGVAFSPDGSLLAVAHEDPPYLTVYTVSGTTLTKIGDPATLPASNAAGTAFSPDGSLLAVAHTGSPYLTVYTVSGTTLTKISDPSTLPGSNALGVSFSPDGTLLSVAHFNSPYLTVYSILDTTLTKIGDPATLPASSATDVCSPPLLNDHIRNPLTGSLHVRDSTAPSGNKSRLTAYPQNPVPNPVYEAPEIDIAQDGTVRIWADITATLESEQTGQADATFEADWRTAAAAYDGFQAIDVAEVTARYVKGRVSQDATDGAAFLERMAITVDSEERTEKASGVAVPDTGLDVVFDVPFFTVPNVQVTADDNSSPVVARYAMKSAVTVSGFTIRVFNSSGTAVAGTVDWEAKGV